MALLLGAAGVAATMMVGCGNASEGSGTGPLITQRNCDAQVRPPQVVLRAEPGRPARCFGGGVGAMRVPDAVVTMLESGGYTVCVGRDAESTCLDPGHSSTIITPITTVGICPAGEWSGCLDRLPVAGMPSSGSTTLDTIPTPPTTG